MLENGDIILDTYGVCVITKGLPYNESVFQEYL